MLTACIGGEVPTLDPFSGAQRIEMVNIGIQTTQPEQLILGEIYYRLLEAQGVNVNRVALEKVEGRNALEILHEEDVDLVITCTGRLLEKIQPAAAQTIIAKAQDPAPFPGGEDLTVLTYDMLVGALPAAIRSVDPSPAQGCVSDDNPEGLPQNIIPLFKKSKLERSQAQRINAMTRVLSTEDMAEMVEELEETASVSAAVGPWLLEYASINIGNPRQSGAEATVSGSADAAT